jgi:hypothetical protein
MHRSPKPPLSKPAGLAHLDVIGRKVLAGVASKNVSPWFAPDSLRKCIIIRLQFCFNVSRQSRGQPAVTCIDESSFAKIRGECDFASPRLKPSKRLVGLAERAQYVARHTHCEWPDRFITPDLDISEFG